MYRVQCLYESGQHRQNVFFEALFRRWRGIHAAIGIFLGLLGSDDRLSSILYLPPAPAGTAPGA